MRFHRCTILQAPAEYKVIEPLDFVPNVQNTKSCPASVWLTEADEMTLFLLMSLAG
jgi:hypothetical protein